jgi:hypothetical protein
MLFSSLDEGMSLNQDVSPIAVTEWVLLTVGCLVPMQTSAISSIYVINLVLHEVHCVVAIL